MDGVLYPGTVGPAELRNAGEVLAISVKVREMQERERRGTFRLPPHHRPGAGGLQQGDHLIGRMEVQNARLRPRKEGEQQGQERKDAFILHNVLQTYKKTGKNA